MIPRMNGVRLVKPSFDFELGLWFYMVCLAIYRAPVIGNTDADHKPKFTTNITKYSLM
jgi:hypothetical protein